MKLVLLRSISVRYVCWLINSPLVCSPTSKSLFHVKNPPAEELPQLCSSNHLEIFFVARKHLKRFFFFLPQVLICWQLLLCVRFAQKLRVWATAAAEAAISWSLAHYRVTTVWLHVEADHTTLGKFCGEDCGLEGSCPHSDNCLARFKKFCFLKFDEKKIGINMSSRVIFPRGERFGSVNQK